MKQLRNIRAVVAPLLARGVGVLKLEPTFVHRFYPDFNRLGQKKLKTNSQQSIPERWIGSSVEAVNPPPMPGGGLSMVRGARPGVSLRDAVKAMPGEILGEKLLAAHGAELRVLVKILDPAESIVFHLHATDRQVSAMRGHFKGHRFGKDEAYYFLEAPKALMPYTHVGIYPGVTRRELVNAVRKGREYALELSPAFYQEFEPGFFVPAGVPHRPGSALTLEIQQPSDVYTLLETHSCGKEMAAGQIHPGFRSLDEAFGLIDLKTSERVGELKDNRLVPRRCEESTSGGEIDWIYPTSICRKFGGKRVRVARHVSYCESSPFILFIWRGSGLVNGRRVGAGDEFVVTYEAARAGVELESDGRGILEAFTFFPSI